jgi:hypothetical protein
MSIMMKVLFSEISCFEWLETPEEVAIKIHMLEQEFFQLIDKLNE